MSLQRLDKTVVIVVVDDGQLCANRCIVPFAPTEDGDVESTGLDKAF